MDSMINRYTADRKIRSDDAYTPDGEGGKRPDYSVNVYAQRCRQAYKGVPVVIGGIEASLRRIAHYDYWSEKVKRSVLLDSKADMLVYGNGERQIVEIAHRLAAGEDIKALTDIRGTAYAINEVPAGWYELDSSELDTPGEVIVHGNPYDVDHQTDGSCKTEAAEEQAKEKSSDGTVLQFVPRRQLKLDRSQTVIRLPDFEKVKVDNVMYAHASRILHLETNPGNARALVQTHGKRQVWMNPPPIPLTTKELDAVFELPYTRKPYSGYGQKNVPAYEMIRFSINIMRGCFGGCTFCSITEHEGRIIQNRSENSIIKEIETIRDTVPGFTGHISDLGGPTANMYRLACKSKEIEAACRKPACVFPDICHNLNTDHSSLISLYKRARNLPGIKKIFIASGLRYDLAVKSPKYVKELVTHHVGGYLKIAPEHTEEGPLSKMMKPGIGTYDRFKEMFERFSKEAGKEQYLIPYFIAAHPGTTDEDMMNLAIWLKRSGFRADQVQTFLPSPMSTASAMYNTGLNPLRKISADGEKVPVVKGIKQRRLHKAFLRYHDPNNWPLLRDALKKMGRSDLIGNGKRHLIPLYQPAGTGGRASKEELIAQGKVHKKGAVARRKPTGGKPFKTQHTGLPTTPKLKKKAASKKRRLKK
jgi:uncharacterized radical SAM protein YgiQ